MPNCVKPKITAQSQEAGINFPVALKQNHAKRNHMQ
jgi:hypothetical protein